MIISCPNCGCKYNLTRKPPMTFHCRKCSFTVPFNIILNESQKSPSIQNTNSDHNGDVTTNTIPNQTMGGSSTLVEEKTRVVDSLRLSEKTSLVPGLQKKTKGILQISFLGKNYGIITLPRGNFFNLGRLSSDGTANVKLTPDISMSRIHAGMRSVTINGELAYQINSAKETNPVYVNGKPIPKGKAFNLKSGDTLRMGETIMVFKMI